jgi:hypothetical protein
MCFFLHQRERKVAEEHRNNRGVTLPNADAIESKFSNASVISARDTQLMQEKREEIEANHALIIERYKALQLKVDMGLLEIMGQIPHVSLIPSDIRPSATGDFPSVAVGSFSCVGGKNSGASGAPAEENGNSVFSPKGLTEAVWRRRRSEQC